MITTWYQPTCVVENVQLALLPAARDAPEPLELVPAEGVQPLVPRRVLDEPGLVAEPVVAVLPHAVEVGLVLPVVAVGEVTILVESEHRLKSMSFNVGAREILLIKSSDCQVWTGVLCANV